MAAREEVSLSNNISFSKAETYNICPRSYQYKYEEKLSPVFLGSPLIFGTAIDSGINVLLEGGTLLQAKAQFIKMFSNQNINGTNQDLVKNPMIVYSNADCYFELLQQDDFNFVCEHLNNNAINHKTLFQQLRDAKSDIGFKVMQEADRSLYNLYNWLALKNKGLLMLDAYQKHALPKLSKVLAIQEYITLTNSDGDKVRGVVDLVADVEGHGTVILDNKTASKKYEEDAVKTSGQLSLYLHALQDKYKTRKAGFIVLNKSVVLNKKKVCSICSYDGSGKAHRSCNNEVEGDRCNGSWIESYNPEISVQFMVDEVPKETEETVLSNIDSINEKIKAKEFPRNEQSCKNYWGRPCEYYLLCHHDSMEGLIKLSKKEKYE